MKWVSALQVALSGAGVSLKPFYVLGRPRTSRQMKNPLDKSPSIEIVLCWMQVAVSGAAHLVARAKSSGATHVVAADVSKVP